MMTESLKLIQVVATFELSPIDINDIYEPLKLRIEILLDHESNSYFPRIYRWETFRVQPTFPQNEGQPDSDLADHEFLVADTGIDYDEIIGDSIEEVLDKVKIKFREILFLPTD